MDENNSAAIEGFLKSLKETKAKNDKKKLLRKSNPTECAKMIEEDLLNDGVKLLNTYQAKEMLRDAVLRVTGNGIDPAASLVGMELKWVYGKEYPFVIVRMQNENAMIFWAYQDGPKTMMYNFKSL